MSAARDATFSKHGFFVTVTVVAALVTAACSPGATSTTEGHRKELVVAAAINRFASVFPRDVVDTPVVRVPDDLDLTTVAAALDQPRQLTAEPISGGPYWEVIGVHEEEGIWQVDMASVDGAQYFSGSLFFLVRSDGTVEPVEPEERGLTPTTSVS